MEDVPLGAERFRILNPEVVRKTGQALQNYAVKKGEVSFFLLCGVWN